jgi:hypothetical protein
VGLKGNIMNKNNSEKSQHRLYKFLSDEYIDKGGADNMSTAIRDCLTDMFHLWDNLHDAHATATLQERVRDAHEVYLAEKSQININS